MMLAVLAILATQAAPATGATPQRWSILVPVPDEPCASHRDKPKAGADAGAGEVVVCGDPLPSQRLPLPDEAVPDGPRPANPALSGAAALALEATPCAARQSGCPGAFGPPILPLAKAAIGLAKDALAKRPDTSHRVAIPLDDPVPPPAEPVPAAR